MILFHIMTDVFGQCFLTVLQISGYNIFEYTLPEGTSPWLCDIMTVRDIME